MGSSAVLCHPVAVWPAASLHLERRFPTDADTDADTDTDTDTDADTDTEADTDIDCSTEAWADPEGSDKGAWMAACVMPPLTTTFQDHDADRFADFECATCHKSMDSGDMSMPAVFAIDFADAGSWPEGTFVGDGMGFMAVVTGQMVGILGVEPFDSETGEGFGCYGCHSFAE